MALYIPSLPDPMGLRGAATTLGDILQERLQSQNQAAQQQRRGTLLDETFQVLQQSQNPQDKMLAIQKYAAATGDTQSFGPLLNDIIKENAQQRQAQATFDFLSPLLGGDLLEEGAQVPPGVSPGAISGLTQLAKPTYEPESEKLEAKRVSELADKVVNEYEAAEAADSRLRQMETAVESGQLPNPMMVNLMERVGIPLGVLQNPLAENYDKNVNEFVREVKNYFPGQIRVAEIEYFMKSIPTLMNSDKGKELIIKNMQLRNEMAKERYKAYEEILEENRGRKPQNLDIKINRRTREARQRIGDEMQSNLEEAKRLAQLPEKATVKGQRLTVNQATQYLQAAAGDKAKAQELARRDGYVF